MEDTFQKIRHWQFFFFINSHGSPSPKIQTFRIRTGHRLRLIAKRLRTPIVRAYEASSGVAATPSAERRRRRREQVTRGGVVSICPIIARARD